MNADQADTPEFSRPIDLTRLGDREVVQSIEATDSERAALAARFGLVALESLAATLKLRRVRGGAAIRLSGTFSANLAQACVVTLEPVPQRLEETFEVLYAPDTAAEESMIGANPDMDWPEPLPDGVLDMGEAVAQQLSLTLDPYPRAPGSELDSQPGGETAAPAGPFAALGALRKGPRSSG
jgi:uncharacterized metal-binding protein YceD (DUF177 family)